jgi:predicted ATP-dependent endonuclease of OLD family
MFPTAFRKITPDNDPGFQYLVDYNFYKELIDFYNYENPRRQIPPLYESFTLIGGYRNYHLFNPSVSLQGSTAAQQIQNIRVGSYSKSLNSSEDSEPPIFNLVRLRVAGVHYEMFGETTMRAESEEKANSQEFLVKINKRLKLVNLEVKIQLLEKNLWAYSFQFFDLKREKPITDINSLSAGQKAIVHLVFEAYGRGDLKGGLVIIDEPEIHLHHQFQNEYLNVVNEINKEQNCQYILVTHSESLINSSTIGHVKRFALDADNNTVVKVPTITANEKTLIKILDNTRSTYAFFGKKVLLVEGETDRYFFKALIQCLNPELNQEIAVLDVIGKGQEPKWRAFFESFGLIVYFVGDFDNLCKIYNINPAPKLKTPASIARFKLANPTWETVIKSKYRDRIFILKDGDLEHYLGTKKDLGDVVKFCNEELTNFLARRGDDRVKEIKGIYRKIIKN